MEREIRSFLSGYSYLQPEKSRSQPGNFPGSQLLSTSLNRSLEERPAPVVYLVKDKICCSCFFARIQMFV